MSTDSHFLAAIAAALLDALPKLVYANWLDERGDPRGELLRLDQALPTTPPGDDHFWQLHARRRDLTDGVEFDWLTAVRVGNDCTPVLAHGWPDDVKGRWRTVRAAAERLLGTPIGDVGRNADAVRRAEEELGQPLPESLREWVSFVVDACDWRLVADAFLRDFESLLFWMNGRELILLSGEGRDGRLAVPVENLGDDDPSVFEYEEGGDDDSWELNDDARGYPAVSEFALFHLLNECHGTGGRLEVWVPDTDELRAQLNATFPPPVEFAQDDVWELPGILVRIHTRPGHDQDQVTVSVQEGVPAADVPDFLFAVGRGRGRNLSGLFIPDFLREPQDARTHRLPPIRWISNPAETAYSRGQDFSRGQNGRQRDDAETVRWYRIAADQGHTPAMYECGRLHALAIGVPQDHAEALVWYRRAAEQGYALALYTVGCSYIHGRGVPIDFGEGCRWLQRAADAGVASAITELGNTHWHARGVEKDWERAVELYRQAVALNDPTAMSNLGCAYRMGRGVPQDLAQGLEWYRKAADLGSALAAYCIGHCYRSGEGVQADLAEAHRWFQTAADRGDTDGMTAVGYSYQIGRAVEIDFVQMLAWYSRAVEAGNEWAMNNLGCCHRDGLGVPHDYAEAVRLFKMAAEKGHADAMNNIAWAYRSGHGVPEDLTQMMEWYTKAAEAGSARAMYNLGRAYRDGSGTAVDHEAAVDWFRKAMDAGEWLAACDLGVQYERGHGVPQDYVEAMRLFRLAAEKGDSTAHWNVGELYELGNGVAKDLAEAVAWYRKAADLGYEPAKAKLAELEAV